MKSIEIRLKGKYSKASAVRSGQELHISHADGYSVLTLPSLDQYELIDVR